MPRNARRVGRIVALYALSGCLALLGAEAWVRVARQRLATPEELARRSLQYVPAVFARNLLAEGPHTASLDWGASGLEINSRGYRGPEFEAVKPDGVVRIMVFGGSAVFDAMQPSPHDWPTLLGAELRRRGHAVEVINAGIPGHASCDSLGRFLMEGHLFAPDLVLLYNAWNDIKLFHEDRPLLRALEPWVPGRDLRKTYAGPLDRWLSEWSQVYLRLRARYIDWSLRPGPEGSLEGLRKELPISPAAVGQYRFNASVFARAVRAAGGEPVLVTQARLVSHTNTPRDRERIAYGYVQLDHEHLVEAFELTDRALREVAAEEGAALVDASAEMTGAPELFEDHVHLSRLGSERLARLVADALEPRLDGPAGLAR